MSPTLPDAIVPSLTDTLCTRCGLCCDGTLFADVELTGPAEAVRLELMGLEVEENDTAAGVLSQPCAALKGTRCGIYAHRPRCCRTFECQLLQEAQRGTVTVERALEHIAEALQRIRRVRELLTQLGQRDVRLPLKERCAQALAADAGATPGLSRRRAELEAAMGAVESLIWETFLGSGGKRVVPKARPMVIRLPGLLAIIVALAALSPDRATADPPRPWLAVHGSLATYDRAGVDLSGLGPVRATEGGLGLGLSLGTDLSRSASIGLGLERLLVRGREADVFRMLGQFALANRGRSTVYLGGACGAIRAPGAIGGLFEAFICGDRWVRSDIAVWSMAGYRRARIDDAADYSGTFLRLGGRFAMRF